MKSNLRVLGLALCMLPACLRASAAQDQKLSYQRELSERPAELIPAGTTVPVTLNSTMRSGKSESGAAITATVMQDVPLGAGKTLRAGSKVTGHLVEAISPGMRSDESKISFRFDQVRFDDQTVSITTSLKAVASVMEVDAAQVPEAGGDGDSSGSWTLVQIGGDQVSYGLGGPVMLGSERIGKYTSQGVLAEDKNAKALWLFSLNASGTYGLGNTKILDSGRTAPLGEVTLTSNDKVLKVGKGSAMLLRVERNGPEEAQEMTLSRGTAQ